ncbi:beta-1,6-glucan synthase [Methyloceanibacter sp.]|uniref:glycoside hydrolase family 17 protein n=1 Tax=Methyloceanibacter sp. TaxID=1965321 RepID=UPI002D515906|nr:beta-1,6-glucan synthase [Methyloceanibacter sp.]HZP09877.1 beta-1,6-glucan synthase [Methyloceanibacter sp.]
MVRPFLLLILVACVIAGVWYRLGRPLAMPPSPLAAGEKLTCVSYAPFHGEQAPFTWGLHIPDEQIESDLERLEPLTSCVRTYSAMGPQGRIAALAGKHGLKVLQGIWLNRNRAENRREIESALRLARQHPGVIEAFIVGNEVLLRGELPASAIKTYLEEVKRRSGLPVTYADVWEFWLKTPELASATDFVTIHILPYWEDDPVPAKDAVAHVREIREGLQRAFSGKDILIGEVGWPSQGRMRAGALPSPANQAFVLSGVVAAAKAGGWKVNLIEAFDQPWKRLLEGTVGGYWGLFSDTTLAPKFRFGVPVSNEPEWRQAAGLGIGIALFVFLSATLGNRHRTWRQDVLIAVIALASGLTFGAAAIALPMDSVVEGDRLRSLGMFALAAVVPLAASFALARGDGIASFELALDPSRWRSKDLIPLMLAGLLAATMIAAMHVALGLVFDPRYKDFPLAALTGPVAALAMLAFAGTRASPEPGRADLIGAAVLAGSGLFIIANEGISNWQALLFAALLVALALTLLQRPDERSSAQAT